MVKTALRQKRTTQQTQLQDIAEQLLHNTEDFSLLLATANGFYDFCVEISGLPESVEAIQLASGKAISPNDAATCIRDFLRTARFLQGLEAAILEAQKRFPNTPISILYAGCGPFAPLALAMTARFSAEEIHFTLIDIHQQSLDNAQHLFEQLELSDYLANSRCCDATTYEHPADEPLHIIVTETMQRALDHEPQVAITRQLVPQLCIGGILVPQNICVEAVLCDLSKEFDFQTTGNPLALSDAKNRLPLGNLMALNIETATSGALLEKTCVQVPQTLDFKGDCMLFTTITVFGDIKLEAYESGITYPMALYEFGKLSGGERLAFQYAIGEKPGFQYWQD